MSTASKVTLGLSVFWTGAAMAYNYFDHKAQKER